MSLKGTKKFVLPVVVAVVVVALEELVFVVFLE